MSLNKDNYSCYCKNVDDGKKQMLEFLRTADNGELIKFFNKTDSRSVGKNFHNEFKEMRRGANPEYGFASKMLSKYFDGICKEDFIIINMLINDCEDIKENIPFIPFDKMFVECGIRVLNKENELRNIDSFMVFRNNSSISVFFMYKNSRDFNNKNMSVFRFNEEDINSSNWETVNPKGVLPANKIDSGMTEMREKILKVLKYISYKINTKEFRDYSVVENGEICRKQLVYSSEVKLHKRHFWEDSGRFIIPTLSKEEILARGYGIDTLVHRGTEIRRNVPYVIIGQTTRNKEYEKKQREISFIKKRIWRCEENIYKILLELYPNKIIRRHDRKTLKGLELDFNIPGLRLGIEYDGEQHFDKELYEKLYGDGFEAQVKRDRQKDKLCRKKDIKLVRIKYDDKINKTNIRKKIEAVL